LLLGTVLLPNQVTFFLPLPFLHVVFWPEVSVVPGPTVQIKLEITSKAHGLKTYKSFGR